MRRVSLRRLGLTHKCLDHLWLIGDGTAEAATGERPALLLLLLARTCMFTQTTALPHVMETLAGTFPGQGGSSGSGQPPAFVAGQVGK